MSIRLILSVCAATTVAALALATTACAQQSPTPAPQQPTPGYPANGADVSVADFATAKDLPNTVLLDVRTPAEFAEGHLKGAKLLDFRSPTFARDVSALSPTAVYAVYCRSGNRSRQALDVMARAGLTHAYHLQPGIIGWMDAGQPVVKG